MYYITIITIFRVLFFKYTVKMLVMASSKFCETSTDNVPLLVCVIYSVFLITFNTALQMHNFFFLFGVRSKYNECTFAKGSVLCNGLNEPVFVCVAAPLWKIRSLKCVPFPPHVPGF